MTQLRCTLGALLGLMLAACGDNATIVSVNISYADEIEAPAKVHVKLSQGSQAPVDETFDAPTTKGVVDDMPADLPQRAYFRRYDLSGWADGEATLQVDLLNAAGGVYESKSTTFEVEEGGAVAAYAEFEAPPAEEEPPAEEPPAETGDTTSETSEPASTAEGEVTSAGETSEGESTEAAQ